MTTQAVKLARAGDRMARRWAESRRAWPGTDARRLWITRYQRAARVWQLRRNQAGVRQ